MEKNKTTLQESLPPIMAITKEQLNTIVNDMVDKVLVNKQCQIRDEGFLPAEEIIQKYRCKRQHVIDLIKNHNLQIKARKFDNRKDGVLNIRNVWVLEKDFVDKYFEFKSFNG